ncbi:hypothetical protein F5Y07DRAFT_375449 [Xylaria sp. FL0933]|nr:hypothetical protein F5Y07DRAFT_375449 [Xylaria sp. FL0933]
MSMQAYPKLAPLLLSIIATLTSADNTFLYQESYGAPFPSDADNYTRSLVQNANQHPNATRSVRFKLFSECGDASEGVDWTWRVNVTDFSTPNAVAQLQVAGGYSPATFIDPHVVNTVYEFMAPGMNISSALNDSVDAPFCISNAHIIGMPANVTNTYTDDNTRSIDCTPALGAGCVSAILGTTRRSQNKCFSSGESWFNLNACADTLGYAASQTPKHQTGISTVNVNTANSTLLSTTGFWGAMSDTHNGTSATTYEAAVNQLQVMMITRPSADDSNIPESQLLCMRVNTTQLVPKDPGSGDDGDNDTGGAILVGLRSDVALVTAFTWLSVIVSYYM